MTNKEAIKKIEHVKLAYAYESDYEAFDMAIEVLKQQEPRWILCGEKMPKEHEWIGSKEFGTTISDEVYVTFECKNGERFVKHISFQNGKLSNFDQKKMDMFYGGAVPIAWRPLPEPYREEGEQG